MLAIDGKVDRASWWHTDVTFTQTPAMGSILYMIEAPEVGGDTMWASLQDAYDGLAPGVRTLCDGLIAIHHDPWFAADVDARGGYEWNGVWYEKLLPAIHPVVRTHPETGRNGLFVNGQFTQSILGLSKNESNAILEMLYRHCVAARVHLPVPLAGRVGRLLGQPGHHALRPGRLRGHPPLRPPGDPARRPTVRARHACAHRRLTGFPMVAGLPAEIGVAALGVRQHQRGQRRRGRGHGGRRTSGPGASDRRRPGGRIRRPGPSGRRRGHRPLRGARPPDRAPGPGPPGPGHPWAHRPPPRRGTRARRPPGLRGRAQPRRPW